MISLNKYKDILIIIDMVNGFVKKGAFASPIIKNMVPEMSRYVKEMIDNGVQTVHYTDSHPKDALEFNSYPVHCLKGTKEANPIIELNFPEIEQIEKNSTNGFFSKNPFDYKKDIYIIGCVSEICVFEFALTSQKYRENFHLPYSVNILENLVKTFDAPEHNSKEVHDKAMSILRDRGVNIITN